MIVAGKAYFAKHDAWNLKASLVAWNLTLSIFSLLGFLRTIPPLVHSFGYFAGHEWYCNSPENNVMRGSTGLWFQLWVLSKLP
jgi:hypothetical protein